MFTVHIFSNSAMSSHTLLLTSYCKSVLNVYFLTILVLFGGVTAGNISADRLLGSTLVIWDFCGSTGILGSLFVSLGSVIGVLRRIL